MSDPSLSLLPPSSAVEELAQPTTVARRRPNVNHYDYDIDPEKKVGLLRRPLVRDRIEWLDFVDELLESGWRVDAVDNFWFEMDGYEYLRLLPVQEGIDD